MVSGTDPGDYALEIGRERLRSARRALNHTRYIVDVEGPTTEAEAKARGALQQLRSAMNWLEDSPEFEDAHLELDRAGTFVRQTFGCHVSYRDGGYWQECPAALAHNRVGLSPAMVIGAAECSICGRDPEDAECHHVTGRSYEGERCVRIIKEVTAVLEVSFVGRPAQPDARIQAMSISDADLANELGAAFRPGIAVSCNRCLSRCDGVVRPFEGGTHGRVPLGQ